MPPRAIAAASGTVAVVTPMAPCSTWSLASSTALCDFACGLSATRPWVRAAARARFRWAAPRSTTSAGVGSSSTGRPMSARPRSVSSRSAGAGKLVGSPPTGLERGQLGLEDTRDGESDVIPERARHQLHADRHSLRVVQHGDHRSG